MKIIYILLDAISYKHSWLANGEVMPNLAAKKKNFLNFHKHYSVTHNTRGNLAALFSGVSSSLNKVVSRAHSFADNKYGYLQEILDKHGFSSHYVGTQLLYRPTLSNDNLGFSENISLSPSMADYYIPGEKFNNICKNKIEKMYNEKYFMMLHYTDAHEPYDTPYNIIKKKEFPLIWKFLYQPKNLFYKIPRRFARIYFKPQTIKRNKEFFSQYKDLEYLCPKPHGPVLSPERYPGFYEKCWNDIDFYNEYVAYMIKALKYQDYVANDLINYIKQNFSKNTLIFMSADHGNNGIISPKKFKEEGTLYEDVIHVPLSIFSFDDEINKKFNLCGDINELTSHVDFFQTVLGVLEEKFVDNGYNINLLSPKFKNERFIFSEFNQATKSNYGQIKMYNKEKKIEIRLNSTDNLEELYLCSRDKIINNISNEDFDLYLSEKEKYNNIYISRKNIKAQ